MRVLLFSGGIESTALAYQYRPDVLLTIDYGHKPAAGEIRAAEYLAARLELHQELLSINASMLGAGDMAGKAAAAHSMVTEAWPFRNQFLITLAAMRYAGPGLREIMIGTVITDCVHADGTHAFIERMNALVQCELPNVVVTAPAIAMDTAALVRTSGLPDDLLRWTFSCHCADVACGQCRGCNKTLELFGALGIGLQHAVL